MNKYSSPIYRCAALARAAWFLAVAGIAAILLAACAVQPQAASQASEPAAATAAAAAAATAATAAQASEVQAPEDPLADVVVYASDLSEDALYEFEFWDDPSSPGGTMLGIPNAGGDLDPPPENDPHVIFPVAVHAGTPYRCWIHMKVGAPKGISQANKVWVQFTGAVDAAGSEVFAPDTGSFLTAQGPEQEGWTWVSCDVADAGPANSLVSFGTTGETTVRIQAGMEGVGFDQVVLSPARYLENPPAAAVVEK